VPIQDTSINAGAAAIDGAAPPPRPIPALPAASGAGANGSSGGAKGRLENPVQGGIDQESVEGLPEGGVTAAPGAEEEKGGCSCAVM
jgi:hypothetical protein